MKKPYYIKYSYVWAFNDKSLSFPWKSKYKTKKARDEAAKAFKRKGFKIIEIGEDK